MSPRAFIGLCALFGALASCSLDFSRNIPCEEDGQCPAAWSCDPSLQRCIEGDVVDDGDAADVAIDTPGADTDGGEPDVADASDAADGSGSPADVGADTVDATDATGDPVVDPDAAPDASDAVDDVPNDADTAADSDGGGCEPVPEICDGEDNDCDGLVDNGISCGGPCGADAVEVAVGDAAVCVDLYEASRPDATEDDAGTDSSRATSRANVVPWADITLAEAVTACEAAGRRLCSATEWQAACSGDAGNAYPYEGTYDPQACNGLNRVPRDASVPTASLRDCRSATGTFDQSGNVAEWTGDGRARGGGFASVETNLQCRSVDGSVNPSLPDPSVGFRCCRDR